MFHIHPRRTSAFTEEPSAGSGFAVAVESFTMTGAGNTVRAAALTGDEIEAAFFLAQATSAWDTTVDGHNFGVGMITSTEQDSMCEHASDGLSSNSNYQRSDSGIGIQLTGDTARLAAGSATILSDSPPSGPGVSINWSTQSPTSSWSGAVLMFQNLDNVDLFTFTASNNSTHNYRPGFEPDGVILWTIGSTSATVAKAGIITSLGFAANQATVEQGCAGWHVDENSTSQARIGFADDLTIRVISDTAVRRTVSTAFNSGDGCDFTSNNTSAGDNVLVHGMAFQLPSGAECHVQTGELSSTDPYVIATGMSDPKGAVLMTGWPTVFDTRSADAIGAVSIFDGTNTQCITINAEDGQAQSDTKRRISTDHCEVNIGGTLVRRATPGFNGSDYELDWTSFGSGSPVYVLFVFGDT